MAARAGPLMLGATVALLVVAALMPSALAIMLGLLVDSIERSDADARVALLPLVGFGVVYLLSYLADALATPLEFVLIGRIDGQHRARVCALVASAPTADLVEDGETQRMIREVEADPRMGFEHTPGQGALALVRALTSALGVMCAAAVLWVEAWYLPLVVLAPALINLRLRSRQSDKIAALWRKAVAGELHADVWRRATVAPGPGKESRVLGLARWMTDRMQHHIREANAPFWGYLDRLVIQEWRQLTLIVIGLAPAFGLVTVAAADGRGSLAAQAAVLSAGTAVFQLFGSSRTSLLVAGADSLLTTTKALAERLAGEGELSDDGPPAPRAARAPRDPMAPPTARSPRDPTAPPAARSPRGHTAPPAISFENVSFTYPGTTRPVLSGLNLTIGSGENLALVGLNGSGKSTLVGLLTGLHRPTSGTIAIDGHDLADLDLATWRSRLAVVFHDFVHYPLSLHDNVCLGFDAPAAALERARRETGIARLVRDRPEGWRTELSRSRAGGVDLSGGQWQQVALARAWLAVERGARLLILDEPTAHLDIRTEQATFERLSRLRGRAGSLLISHRLASVRGADRIVLLERGAITESGDHDALMAQGGRYAEMFDLQARRFRSDAADGGAADGGAPADEGAAG